MMLRDKLANSGNMGAWYGFLAYIAWGILPLYWKLLDSIPALEILAHRILWSFVVTTAVLFISRGYGVLLAALSDKRKLALIFLCGFLVSVNWFTYIYAVNSNHVIDASMGYYITPLVVVLLGVMVLKEKLTRWQRVAIILASCGVLVLAVHYGKVPYISLILAGSFSLYGLIKKLIMVDAVTSLALETFIVMPAALIYLGSLEVQGIGAFSAVPLMTKLILAGTGIITSTPLLLFAKGVQQSKLSTMGFLQFLTPTISLMLGIFVFKEYFSTVSLVSFIFIWAALIIYTLSNIGILKERRYLDSAQQLPVD